MKDIAAYVTPLEPGQAQVLCLSLSQGRTHDEVIDALSDVIEHHERSVVQLHRQGDRTEDSMRRWSGCSRHWRLPIGWVQQQEGV